VKYDPEEARSEEQALSEEGEELTPEEVEQVMLA